MKIKEIKIGWSGQIYPFWWYCHNKDANLSWLRIFIIVVFIEITLEHKGNKL